MSDLQRDCFVHSVDVHAGVPPAAFRRCQSFKVHFYDYGNLDSTKGRVVTSPRFNCFNDGWLVELYPRGDSHATEGMTSVFLRHLSDNEINVYFDITVKNNAGGIIKRIGSVASQLPSEYHFGGAHSAGNEDFVKRSLLLEPENLNHGTLVLEIRIRLGNTEPRVNFIPENPIGKHMLKLFLNEESADVLFELASDETSSKVEYRAHRFVLKACAPDLARLCEGCDESTPVPIPDVEPHVFAQLLHYAYGGKVSADWEKDAKKFIDAANKYGVIDLKVEAEAWRVTHFNFTVSNVIEELLYADAKNCPLLREAAMDFILKNAKDVIESDSFENVLMTKTITKEIMLAMAASEKGTPDENNGNTMPINDLRMALYEKGLDIDGSRELLTSRLKK
mmetsp:Transcript_28206/g.60097  ORF Transcript_28206/g.60097 Transcript_28206/m.60097 type:complete len:393 (+) Transcript_28206:428-1606(+)